MQKLELTISQDLNDLENRFLSRAINHSRYVHERAIAYVLGISFILTGLGMLGINFTQDIGCMLAFAAIVAGATLQCTIFAFMMMPCHCGKKPILTAQYRNQLLKQHSKRNIGIMLVVCAVVAFIWNFSLFSMLGSIGLSFGAGVMILMAIQCFQSLGLSVLVVGLITFISAVRNRTEWLNTKEVIPEIEVEKVAHLSEETEDELHSLIDFHLKAGNIVAADRLSRKLLTIVESHHHT